MADDASTDSISRAMAVLSTMLHCRKQAKDLQACRRGGEGCARQEAAFVTCSEAHVGMVVQHLVKIADTHCPDEVEAVRVCRTLRRGECEAEDLAAMRCAALRVISAHAADHPPRGQ